MYSGKAFAEPDWGMKALMHNNQRSDSLSLASKRTVIKCTLIASVILAALCAGWFIAGCIWTEQELFICLFQYTGIALLVVGVVLIVVITAWPDAVPVSKPESYVASINCDTFEHFSGRFMKAVEQEGFALIRKRLLDNDDQFLTFFRDGARPQYIVLSYAAEFDEARIHSHDGYIQELISTVERSDLVLLTHIICAGKKSPALKDYCEKNTTGSLVWLCRTTAGISLEERKLYIIRPKDGQGVLTLKRLGKQLELFMEPFMV